MPMVRFAWCQILVDVRREACPQARWNKAAREWLMTEAEAEAFIAAGHQRLDFARMRGEIAIDGKTWILGFAQGAPGPGRSEGGAGHVRTVHANLHLG